MRLKTTLVGGTALVMHNPRLSNPDDEYSKMISAVTSKRKKTEDDRAEIGKLEFAGGLYIDADGPYLPMANLRRCFMRAATVRRLGTAVERAVHALDQKTYLEYDGPRTVKELWAEPKYQYLASVGVGQKRVMRMRPQFPRWSVTAEWELITDILDLEDFIAIAESAGRIQGLGDNRVNGYGRFSVTVETEAA